MGTVPASAVSILLAPGVVAPSNPVSSYERVILDDVPVGFWRMGEASGTVAADLSGSGHPGTYTNSPTLAQTPLVDKLNKAVSFAVATSYCDFGNAGWNQLSTGTLEAWIKISDTTHTVGIVTKVNAYGLWCVNGKLQIYDPTAAAFRDSGITVGDNAVHHVAVVFGGGICVLYVDGVAAGGTQTFNVLNQANSLLASHVTTDFAGVMDEVALYGRKLSASDILSHYKAAVYSDAVLTDAPLGYWSLDEDVGAVIAADNSNQDRIGTYINGPALQQVGLIQSQLTTTSIMLTGVNYADFGNSATWQIATGTIEAWIKTTQGVGLQPIFVKQNAYGIYLLDGELVAYDWTGLAYRHSTSGNLADGVVHHVALKFGAGTGTLYVDGLPMGGSQTYTVLAQDHNLYAGHDDTGVFWTGWIDALAVYPTKLADANVLAHYTAAITSTAASDAYSAEVIADAPKGYWRLEELTGTTARDSSGFGNNGAYQNAPALGTDPGAIADNTAVTFAAASSQDVSIAHSATLNVGNVFTIEAWVKIIAIGATPYSVTAKAIGSPQMLINPSGLPYLMKDGGAAICHGSLSVIDGRWHHLVATKNGNTVHFYIDGVDRTVSDSNQTTFSTSTPLKIGSDVGGLASNYFDGAIDEVAWYATELSAFRVREHYSTGVTRGIAMDKTADVIIGQRNFHEIEVYSPVKVDALFDPCGVFIDRSVTPNLMYVCDVGHNRILVFQWTNVANWLGGSNQPIRVLGQPDFISGGANRDSGMVNYPTYTPPDAATIAFCDEQAKSPGEGGIGSQMCSDGAGGIYVVDAFNSRVLRYPTGATQASYVFGQADFTGRQKNRDGTLNCTNQSLYLLWNESPNLNSFSTGVCADGSGGFWVADSANHRVLHVPSGSATADQVLGQPDFTTHTATSAPTLSQMIGPQSVCLIGTNLYVADQSANRVMKYASTGANGRAGTVFYGGLNYGQRAVVPCTVDADPSEPGMIWIMDGASRMGADGTGMTVSGLVLTRAGGVGAAASAMVGGILHTADGKYGVITANTTTTITVAAWTGGTPANGNAFWVGPYLYMVRESDGAVMRTYGNGIPDTMGTLVGGNVAFDPSGNALLTEARGANAHNLMYFGKTSADIATPTVTSMLELQTVNLTGLYGAFAVAVANDQLIVADIGRIVFWEGLSVLADGDAARGAVSGVSFSVLSGDQDTAFNDYNMQADSDGLYLWASCYQAGDLWPQIVCWALPLHQGDAPIRRLAPIREFSQATGTGVVCTATTLQDNRNFPPTAGQWGGNAVANELIGSTITCNGKTGKIIANTSNVITVDAWVGGTPANGNAWSTTSEFGHTFSIPALGGGTLDLNPSPFSPTHYWGLEPNHNSSVLWVSDQRYNRVFRIRNPLSTTPIVDCVLGQTTLNGTGSGSGTQQLSSPGSVRLDAASNLYVSDHSLESAGNYRFLRFNQATVPEGNAVIILGPVYDKKFGAGEQWGTFCPAFAPTGQMVVGFNYIGTIPGDHLNRLIWSNAPAGAGNIDGHFTDFMRMPMGVDFDAATGDLYAIDHNGQDVLVYRAPFASAVTQVVFASGQQVQITPGVAVPITAAQVPVTGLDVPVLPGSIAVTVGGVTSPNTTVVSRFLKRWPRWWSNHR